MEQPGARRCPRCLGYGHTYSGIGTGMITQEPCDYCQGTKTVPVSSEVREQLAEYTHDAWSRWMKYLFNKTTWDEGIRRLTIPSDLAARWNRQMHTPYKELPEHEKESDRAEADSILKIISGRR